MNAIYTDRVHNGNNLDVDDDVDLLPTFCRHIEKTYLSSTWATEFTHISQHFEGGASEFRKVLRKHAVKCGFQFKYIKNDSIRIIVVCALQETKRCTWYVHARQLVANGFFYLRKWNSEHSCGVAIHTSKNPLVELELVSDIIAKRVRKRPLTRPTDVIMDFKQDYELDITYRVTWLGVEKARGELFGAHSISFDQLRWYSHSVMEHNPGSYINIEYDDHMHRFTHYFISFKACVDGFNHCRRNFPEREVQRFPSCGDC
ncbi:hypothetical protein ACSBR1_004284 [Camellia fascicularis]